MIIHFGTGRYTLKKYNSYELGLPLNEMTDVEFRIRQRYFEIYWIPVFAIGVDYTMRSPGIKEEYYAPEHIQELMKQQGYDKWRKMFAFALPLVAMIGMTIFGALDSYQRMQYAESYALSLESEKKEREAFMNDPNGYAYCHAQAIHFDSLMHYYAELESPKMVDVDTSFSSLIRLMLNMKERKENMESPYTNDNTMIYIPNVNLFMSSGENQVSDRALTDLFISKAGMDSYHWNFLKDEANSGGSTFFNFADLRGEIDSLKTVEYLVLVRYKGAHPPSIVSAGENSVFNTGVVYADVSIYRVHEKELIEQFEVLVENSDEINYRTYVREGDRSYESESSIQSRLNGDLQNQIRKEVMIQLQMIEDTEDNISSPPAATA